MSTTSIQAEASKPLKKMQECNKCKSAGFPNQMISFERAGEDNVSGKTLWRLLNENGEIHTHRYAAPSFKSESASPLLKRRKVVDISTVTNIEDAKQLIKLGWEYKTVFPATLENIPHYVLVKRE